MFEKLMVFELSDEVPDPPPPDKTDVKIDGNDKEKKVGDGH